MTNAAEDLDLNEPPPAAEDQQPPPSEAEPGTGDPEGTGEGENVKPEEKPKVEFSPEQQEKVEEIVDKTTARNLEKLREEQAEKARMAQELEELRAKIPQATRPDLPEFPDPLDDDFEQKRQIYDDTVKAQAEWDFRQQQEATIQQQEDERQQQAVAAENQRIATNYTERAGKLGVTGQELQQAGDTLMAQGLSQFHTPDLVRHILQDEQGPLITQYLAKNPREVENLRAMDPMQAAVHIATTVKPAAQASNRIADPPPPPTDDPSGAGFPEGMPGLEGATFE